MHADGNTRPLSEYDNYAVIDTHWTHTDDEDLSIFLFTLQQRLSVTSMVGLCVNKPAMDTAVQLFTAPCEPVMSACFSKPAQFQTFSPGVKQMLAVDSSGVVFL